MVEELLSCELLCGPFVELVVVVEVEAVGPPLGELLFATAVAAATALTVNGLHDDTIADIIGKSDLATVDGTVGEGETSSYKSAPET